jgi:GNAT superfamily N-acetyltransferase
VCVWVWGIKLWPQTQTQNLLLLVYSSTLSSIHTLIQTNEQTHRKTNVYKKDIIIKRLVKLHIACALISSEPSMKLTIRPLTPDLWPALEDLFGEHGAVGGCWCMYWRIGNDYRKRDPDANKAAFYEIVKNGPPPGLLAFKDDLAVGWCQVTPRDVLPWLDHVWRLKRVDEVPVWSISCFYVRKGYRRQGVASALISAALVYARDAGAPALEAYPLDADLTPSASSTGYVSTFKRAGFKIVARHVPPRPIMRIDFSEIASTRTRK